MKKAIKAALWSGLVFPGAGHFILKRYVRGLMLLVPAALALALVVNGVLQKAAAIAEKIAGGAVPADATAIAALVSAGGAESATLEIASYVILACWVAGMIDSYRIGRMEDRASAKDA